MSALQQAPQASNFRVAPEFPPVRACIFDMDGLLINSEDIITESINQILEKYGKPPVVPSVRAKMIGIHNSTSHDVFHDWAQLPISREQFAFEVSESMYSNFPRCSPLHGAETLLSNLSTSLSSRGTKIQLALASSTRTRSYEAKISSPRVKKLLDFFPADRRILGDDSRIQKGRGKPAPDVYLVALQALNSSLGENESPITPTECLVFEDSVVGVEAGRRAGMRIIWVPHPDVVAEHHHPSVLAGRTGLVELGDKDHFGKINDGWAETIPSLEHFDYDKYGICVPS
ncbi:HAD-like domain-containing protein [Podospora australis]|uniref:HAD-like domain-containing protein n=1 Tax=Podospora australis TaxID=1536484 RepID=A0AAN6WUJ8_9PEZI|nr:HAD-like domain-containing protein [Podospora australis]